MHTTIRILILTFLINLIVLLRISTGTAIRGNNVRDANQTEFSFVVAITEENEDEKVHPNDIHICTGVLITKFHVLTAQHCLDGEDINKTQVRVGNVNLQKGEKHNIFLWKSYAEWYKETKGKEAVDEHDIAVIVLKTSVDGIKPASIPFVDGDELYGLNVKIAGWGQTNDGSIAEVLQTVQLKIISNEQCKAKIFELKKKKIYLYNRFVCSLAKPWALLGCGDSGGPLLDQKNHLVGINKGTCPNITGLDYPQEFLDQNQLNLHISLQYYEQFIRAAIKIYPPIGKCS